MPDAIALSAMKIETWYDSVPLTLPPHLPCRLATLLRRRVRFGEVAEDKALQPTGYAPLDSPLPIERVVSS
jgi:hypothetical protein